MNISAKSRQHAYLIAFLGGLILVLLFAIVMVKSRTTDVETTVTVSNAAPTIGTVYLNDSSTYSTTDTYNSSGSIALTAGGTKTIYAHAQVSDDNGLDDISKLGAFFYKTGTTCATPGEDTPDNNNCYMILNDGPGDGDDTCVIDPQSATTANVSCPIPLTYYADAGEWNILMGVNDSSDANDMSTPFTTDIDALLALSFPSTLAYSATNLGATSSETTYTVTQYGNTTADAEVRGGDLTCDGTGEIPVENQEWSLTSGSGFSALTTSDDATGIDVPVRTSDSTPTTSPLYWKLTVPSSGVAGACTGTTVFTAAAPV